MAVFTVDVEVSSHDLLKRGILATRLHGSQRTWHRILVDADDERDAVLLAAQIAACHGMPTATYLAL